MSENLLAELGNFTVTAQYHRVSLGNVFVTDGVRYLCEKAGCYWLVDVIASYVPQLIKIGDWLAVCDLVKRESDWLFTLKTEHPKKTIKQIIKYSDFPLDSIKLFVQNGHSHWIVMLPSEY